MAVSVDRLTVKPLASRASRTAASGWRYARVALEGPGNKLPIFFKITYWRVWKKIAKRRVSPKKHQPHGCVAGTKRKGTWQCALGQRIVWTFGAKEMKRRFELREAKCPTIACIFSVG